MVEQSHILDLEHSVTLDLTMNKNTHVHFEGWDGQRSHYMVPVTREEVQALSQSIRSEDKHSSFDGQRKSRLAGDVDPSLEISARRHEIRGGMKNRNEKISFSFSQSRQLEKRKDGECVLSSVRVNRNSLCRDERAGLKSDLAVVHLSPSSQSKDCSSQDGLFIPRLAKHRRPHSGIFSMATSDGLQGTDVTNDSRFGPIEQGESAMISAFLGPSACKEVINLCENNFDPPKRKPVLSLCEDAATKALSHELPPIVETEAANVEVTQTSQMSTTGFLSDARNAKQRNESPAKENKESARIANLKQSLTKKKLGLSPSSSSNLNQQLGQWNAGQAAYQTYAKNNETAISAVEACACERKTNDEQIVAGASLLDGERKSNSNTDSAPRRRHRRMNAIDSAVNSKMPSKAFCLDLEDNGYVVVC